jgi:hypothetical protein
MRTLDYLKDYYNLHGKTISWAVIEEISKSDRIFLETPALPLSEISTNEYNRCQT